jgi:hypothetical protein
VELSDSELENMGKNAGNFVYQQPNATEIILKKISEM